MLRIIWKVGPEPPLGLQGPAGGFLGTMLVYTCGAGQAPAPERGFTGTCCFFQNESWALDLARKEAGWIRLPDYPGAKLQELFGITVENALYCWGGFNFTDPYTYKDGYRLSRNEGKWTWDNLPLLPYSLHAAGICAIGTKIYACGGGDFGSNPKYQYTATDRYGKNPRLGAHLLLMDTKQPEAGWKRLPDCPGTPRMLHAMEAVGGRIYVIGGAKGHGSEPMYRKTLSVVDNWAYDPGRGEWTQLRDLPISSGNFYDSGSMVYRNRYIILVGGYQYGKIANPDGTARGKYGKPFKHYPDKEYYSDVFVYDTRTGLFGRADPLPLNNNCPFTLVRGDKIYLIGGEIGNAIIKGKAYLHYPALLLEGKIEEIR